MFLCLTSVSFAKSYSAVKKATIRGEIVKTGDEAAIVQSRISADNYVTSGYNYGDTSKGYYLDNGIDYIITYGPPKSGSGGYVVVKIEKSLVDVKKVEKNTNNKVDIKSISVNGKMINIGDTADQVFEVLSKDSMVSQTVEKDPNNSSSLLVIKNYQVNDKKFTLYYSRVQDPGPYKVTKIKEN